MNEAAVSDGPNILVRVSPEMQEMMTHRLKRKKLRLYFTGCSPGPHRSPLITRLLIVCVVSVVLQKGPQGPTPAVC